MSNEPENQSSQKKHRTIAIIFAAIGVLFLAGAGVLLTMSKASGVVWTPAAVGIVFIGCAVWWATRK
jgi:drug/metabolite transporter superfamily protein YnfA